MPDSIKLLCEIQNIDIEIERLEKEKLRHKKDLDGMEAGSNKIREEIEARRKELEVLRLGKKDREEKLRENREKIEKDQKRANELKTEKQFAALTKEVSNAQKASKLLDIEINAIAEKCEGIGNDIEEKEKTLAEKEERRSLMGEEFEKRKTGWESARKEEENKREAISKALDPRLLKRYETIKTRRGGVGVANVKNETCLGCYIQIPPQVFIQLRKGSKEIITCPHCHRILYFEDTSPALASASTVKD
ncbi:MAG: hypothetical protein HY883_04055 [Deltaproteobacteria bacterium]|nr:hypothetical protein [Deltaproteobacteria bacterium]